MDAEVSDETFIQNFMKKFHSLEGVTLDDRNQNLNQLTRESTILHTNEAVFNTLLTKLKPETHLEHIFFIKFLIHFRQYKELFNEFMKGNEIVINLTSKCTWIFEKALADTGPEYISRTLPNLSYSVRMKFLKKLETILGETEADPIFDIVRDLYGFPTACLIVTSCSVDKIRNLLQNYPMKLNSNQLKRLYDKNPHLINIYLQQHEKIGGTNNFTNYNPVFKYIATKDPDMFQDLCQKYGLKIRLGRRTTKKIISVKKQDIIECPELLVKNLNSAKLIRKLGEDFKLVYKKLFPKTVEDSPNAETSRLLKYYPKNGRYHLLQTTFNETFAKKLDDSPHLIDEYVLEMVPEADERERLAKIKANGDPDLYLNYYRPDHCFEVIKQKINFARVPYERGNLLVPLVEACVVNHDYNALLVVAKFVAERFKNDSFEVQQKFLQTLLWKKCNFDQLNVNHWYEISQILVTRFDQVCHCYTTIEIVYKYIEFLIKSDKPIEDVVSRFLSKQNVFAPEQLSYIQSEYAQKKLLLCLIQLAPQLTTTVEELHCKLLLACKKYNHDHPKSAFDVFQYPQLLQSMKRILLKEVVIEENTIPSALSVIICTKQESKETEELRELFWKNAHLATPFIVKWFLKFRPDVMNKHFDLFLDFSMTNTDISKDRNIWSTIKCYSYLNFDKRTTKACTNKLTRESGTILSYLMESKDFLKLLDSLKPKTSETTAEFKIKKSLILGLKNTTLSTETVDTLLKLLHGDVMPLCFGPLYAAFCKIPAMESYKYINALQNWNVAQVQVFTLHLISVICDSKTSLHHFKQSTSPQAVVFSYKAFLRNPSEMSLMFKEESSNVTKSNKIIYKIINAKGWVPLLFRLEWFECLWKMVSENDKYKTKFLKSVGSRTILELEPVFIHDLIDKEICTCEEMNKIASVYLIENNSVEKIEVICNALKKYQAPTEFSSEKINKFISTFFETYMKHSSEDHNTIGDFLIRLQSVFSSTEILDECILLSLAQLKNYDVLNFSTSIIKLHCTLIEEYSETITVVFARILKNVLAYFCPTNPQLYEFYCTLLACKTSPADILLVIKLLPTDSEPQDVESCKYYESILSQLAQLDSPSVQLHLNLHFRFYKLERNVSYYEKINNYCINTSSWLVPGARRRVGYNYY